MAGTGLAGFDLYPLRELGQVVEAAIRLACQDEELLEVPSSLWQHFKERWFPKWLKKRFPVRYDQWFAEHKFPEVEFPDFGREFIHFKKVKYEDLEREARKSVEEAE